MVTSTNISDMMINISRLCFLLKGKDGQARLNKNFKHMQSRCQVRSYSLMRWNQTLIVLSHILQEDQCSEVGFPHPQLPRQAMVWVADSTEALGPWQGHNTPIYFMFFCSEDSLHISRPLGFPRTPHYCSYRNLSYPPFIKWGSLSSSEPQIVFYPAFLFPESY